MFKFKQGKNLILILLCLMLIVLASFSCVYVVTNHNEKTEESHASASVSMYDFWVGNGMDWSYGLNSEYTHGDRDKNYKNYDTYTISSPNELDIFRHLISADGFTFGEKNVVLMNNIDMSAYNWEPGGTFKGVFYGSNHTISNLTSKVNQTFVGFFAKIENAEIHDLKIDGFTIEIDEHIIDLVCGAIAGHATYNAIIDNCIVENFKVSLNFEQISGAYVVSGILGMASDYNKETQISITNVYIGEFTITIPEKFNTTAGINEVHFNGIINLKSAALGTYRGILNIHDCFIKDKTINKKIGTDTKEISGIDLKNIGGLYYSVGDFVSGDDDATIPTDCTYNRYSLYTGSHTGYDLDVDKWYVPPTNEFNEGYPYLKSFITFNTWTFKSGENGTLNNSTADVTVKVPTTINISPTTTQATIIFYGTVIEAKGNENYKFTNWTKDESKKLVTANFGPKMYVLRFWATGKTSSIKYQLKNGQETILNPGEYVDFNVSFNDSLVIESNTATGNQKMLRFYVKGVGQIIYFYSDAHYMTDIGADFDSIIESSGKFKDAKDGTTYGILPMFNLKTYGVGVK